MKNCWVEGEIVSLVTFENLCISIVKSLEINKRSVCLSNGYRPNEAKTCKSPMLFSLLSFLFLQFVVV